MKYKTALVYVFFAFNFGSTSFASSENEEIVELPRMPRPVIDDSSFVYRVFTAFVGSGKAAGHSEFRLASCYVYGLEGKERDPVRASQYLLESAQKGYADALLFIGMIMLNLHGDELSELASKIGFNEKTGTKYLERAKKLGSQSAEFALDSFSEIRDVATLCGPDMTGDMPQGMDRRAIAKLILQKQKPMGCYLVAEALLRPEVSVIFNPLSLVSDEQSRRCFAIKLLDVALRHNIDPAKKLLATVQEEDRIYEAICIMMEKDIEDGISINGLEIGDSGFQEQYIDQLYEKQVKVMGRVLERSDCDRFKKAMALRVRSLFYVFSQYFQFMNATLSKSGVTNSKQINDNLLRMVTYTKNRTLIELPYLDNGEVMSKNCSILKAGVASPVQPLEAERAYEMMVSLADDFKDVPEENQLEVENAFPQFALILPSYSVATVLFRNAELNRKH